MTIILGYLLNILKEQFQTFFLFLIIAQQT